ncbi:MAG: hypothetical protein ACPGU5_03115 [Lishizhenia sp.]
MEKLFRLRTGNTIVGYKKQMGNFMFYSKDLYGWNGKEIDFEFEDDFTGFKDKHDRKLFVEDIVVLTAYPQDYFIITLDTLLNKFYLVNYKNSTIFDQSIDLIFKDKAKVGRVAFTFEQNAL